MKRVIVVFLLCLVFSTPLAFAHESARLRPRFFSGDLSVFPAPAVGQRSSLILDLTVIAGDCENATVQFRTPKGVDILGSGVFEGQYLTRDAIHRYSVDIVALEGGSYKLQATVYFQLPDGQNRAEHFFTYLDVQPGKYASLLAPARTDAGVHPTGAPLATGGTISVSGYVTYYNDNLKQMVPIRKVGVLLFEKNSRFSRRISSTYTDDNGFYSFADMTNVDPEDGTGRDIQVRLYFENDALRIERSGGTVYSFESPIMYDVSDGQIDADYSLEERDQDRGVGHIFNTIMDASKFLQKSVGWQRAKITVKWPYGDWSNYNYGWYTPGGSIYTEFIQVPDGMEWDRPTMLHEYGHAVMIAMYGYNANVLPPYSFEGEHYIYTVSDPGFAMREGWAGFFEAAVDDNAYNLPGYGNRNVPNVESNKWWTGAVDGTGSNTRGEIVEGTVASILWDIADTGDSYDESPGVDDDSINGMFRELWEVMLNHKPGDILEFWDYWLKNYYDQIQALQSIYTTQHVKVTPPWDVNGDGNVDMLDFTSISSHFGQSISNPVQPNPDVNRDGVVDIVDLVIWAINVDGV